jgi:hypothetical protein
MLIAIAERNRQGELNVSLISGTTNSQKDKNRPFLLHEDISKIVRSRKATGPGMGPFYGRKTGSAVA